MNNIMSDFIEKMVDIKRALERDITCFKDTLVQKEEHLKTLNDFIYKYCKHVWIKDYIDIKPEKGMNITYCKYCELSRKAGK